MASNKFRFPNQGARELNDLTSWNTISAGLNNARGYAKKVAANAAYVGRINAENEEGRDRIRYGQFTAGIGGIRGQIGGQSGQRVDASINSFLQRLQAAGGHKIGSADLSKAIADLHKEIGRIATTMGGAQGNLLKEFTRDLKEAKLAAARGGIGAVGGGTRDAIKTAFGLKADNSIEEARKKIASDVRQAARSLADPSLRQAVAQVIGEMHRLSNAAKTTAEKQKILANAQTKLSRIAGGATGADKTVMEGIVKSTGKNTAELKKSLMGQAANRKGLEFNNRLAALTHGIGSVTRYLIPLKRTLDIGNAIFQSVNSKFNQFARMQMRISAERGGFGRQVRGAGINYGHMMAAIGAGRSAGMEDRQVVGQMVGLQTQLAQARWGEGGLAENVGRWGISVYNGAGDVKQAHEMMIEFSRKLRSLGSDMEKLQFLHAIGRSPEEMEYVANYEKSARRMEMIKKNPHLQTVLDKADILDESGYSAKADAATKIELRRREILNQNAIDEGVIPGLIRSMNPENWLFSDWTARKKGVAAAREEISGNKATRALEAMLVEMRKNGAKKGNDFLSGFTITDIMALAGGHGGWAEQDKEEKGTQSFVVDLESAFEKMSGFSADTRTNLEKLGDGLLTVVKKVVDLFAGLLEKVPDFIKNNPVSGTAATVAGGAGLLWGAGKLVKGGLGWVGRALGMGGGAAAGGAAAAGGRMLARAKPKGRLGAILAIGALAAATAKGAYGGEAPEGKNGGAGGGTGGGAGGPQLPPGPWNGGSSGVDTAPGGEAVMPTMPTADEASKGILPKGGTPTAGGETLEGMVGSASAIEEQNEADKKKKQEERNEKYRKYKEELRKRRKSEAPKQESGGWWETTKAALSGAGEGFVKGLGKGVNAIGSAVTLGFWDGPFSKESLDIGYEDWMTKAGDISSNIGGYALGTAATMGVGGALRGSVAVGKEGIKAGAKGLVSRGGKEIGKGVTTRGAQKFTGKRAANIMKDRMSESTRFSGGNVKKVATGAAITVGVNKLQGMDLSGEGAAEGAGVESSGAGSAGGAAGAAAGKGNGVQGTNFVSGSGGSLINLVKPIRDMVRGGASYDQLSKLLGQHGMDLPDMSVLQSKDFLTDDSKAMEMLKGLGYANVQRRGTEKYGKPMDLKNFLKNVTDDIAVTYKNAGGIMNDDEIIQTFGRQEAGASDVSQNMINTYMARGHELGIGAQEKMAQRVNRIGKEHKDWDQNKVRAAATKEQRQEFLKGLSQQQLEMYGSQGGTITDPEEIAKRSEALFKDAGMTRSESQKMTHEQVADFDKFLDENKDVGMAQLIARFSNQTGLSKDVIRNNLIHGGKFEDMTEEAKKEYMKGSAYKSEQKTKKSEERLAARKAQRSEAAKGVSEAEATKYLGDEGDAKEFISLRERVQKGETLSEAEQTAYDNYTDQVGRKANRAKKTKAYKPLNQPYKPTKAEQADIDAADRESARLVKEQKAAKGRPPLAQISDVRYMHSIRARGGGTKRDLERGFGKERMEQYNAAEARGELSPIDSKVLSREQKTMARQAKRDKRLAKAGVVRSGFPMEGDATQKMAAAGEQTAEASKNMAAKGAAAENAAASAKNAGGGAGGGSTEKNITINMGGQNITQNIQGAQAMDAEGMKRGTMQGASEIRDKTAETVVSVTKSMGTY